MTKLKICGLSREEDISYVNELKPYYIGFVFAKSKRQVSYLKATLLKSRLNKDIKAVGVFVNEDIELISSLAKNNVIDIVQLHGDEDNAYIKKLKNILSIPVIKAIRVWSKEDIVNSNKFTHADYLLFDKGSSGSYGGLGETFDWTLFNNLTIKKPFFLAGGISAHNCKRAVTTVRPYAIDCSSGVETNGFKSKNKITNIMKIMEELQ